MRRVNCVSTLISQQNITVYEKNFVNVFGIQSEKYTVPLS